MTLVELIKNHPCFYPFSTKEINDLSNLMIKQSIKKNAIVVNENELVDAIYFIVDGSAEISKIIDQQTIPIATLIKGEAIGLNDAGFYSQNGLRTATAKGQTDLTLYKLNVKDFYEFLRNHPHANEIFRNSAEIIYKMNLIKQANPFAEIDMEHIRDLAQQLREENILKDQIIFHQGELGKECYLIEAGEVEIFIEDKKGHHVITTLAAPAIFGETALLMNLPRNASARALMPTKLLSINRDQLEPFIKTNKHISNALMTLIKTRCRPQRFAHIEHFSQNAADKEELITLKDPKEGNYYRLCQQGWFIWERLDGRHSLHDITLAFHKQYEVFDPDMIAEFVMDLEEAHFIEKCIPYEETNTQQSFFVKLFSKIQKIMEASFDFTYVDEWVSRTYKKGFFLLYTVPAQIIIGLLVIFGIILFALKFNTNLQLFTQTQYAGWIALAAFSTSMASAVFHELAHAFTTKFYGREVAGFGIGWYWVGPVAICDTSDMWLSNKSQRLMVDLAGLYTDLAMAALAMITTLFIKQPEVILFLWFFSFSLYLSVFKNLAPYIELDGYYALMDILGKDNLRESAVVWLVNDVKNLFKKPNQFQEHKSEIIYWVSCGVYLILEAIITYEVMHVLLYGLFGVKNFLLNAIIPIFIVIFSTLGIWSDIRARNIDK